MFKCELKSVVHIPSAEHLRQLKQISGSFSSPRRVINIPMIPQVFLRRIRGNGPSNGCVLKTEGWGVGWGVVMVQATVIFGCEHGGEIQT